VLRPPRTGSSAARAPTGPPADTAAFDAHCHVFNGKDIPVAGFLSSWGRGQSSLHGIPVAPDALAAILLAVGTALEVAVHASVEGATERDAILARIGRPAQPAAPRRIVSVDDSLAVLSEGRVRSPIPAWAPWR